jgi:hypothetical protein
MKKIIILIISLIFLPLQIQAQDASDVLYLKNGSRIYGKLVEVADNQYKMKTADGFLFTFSSSEIEKFVLGSKSEPKEVKIINPNGFGFGIESGFLLGSGNEHFFLLFSFNPMVTYTLNSRHTFGLVSGVELFDQFHVPLFLEYRYNILSKSVSPFIYARGGGLMSLGGDDSYTDYKGGWSCGAGTGFRWPIGGYESYLKFGFRYAYTVYTEENSYMSTYPLEYTVKYTYHNNFYRLELKWGFKF